MQPSEAYAADTQEVLAQNGVTDEQRAIVRRIFEWQRCMTTINSHLMRLQLPCGLVADIERQTALRPKSPGEMERIILIHVSFVDSIRGKHRREVCHATRAARMFFRNDCLGTVDVLESDVVVPGGEPFKVREDLSDEVVTRVMDMFREVHSLRMCSCNQAFYVAGAARACTGCELSKAVGRGTCGVCFGKTGHVTPCCANDLCPKCNAKMDTCPFCRSEWIYHDHGGDDEDMDDE
jgi:hypothetical protein